MFFIALWRFLLEKSFDDGNFQNRKIEILNISILGICERQCFSSILENFCEYSNWYNRLYFSPQMLSNYIWVIKKHINTYKNHETLFKLLLNRLQSAMEVLYWVVMHPPFWGTQTFGSNIPVVPDLLYRLARVCFRKVQKKVRENWILVWSVWTDFEWILWWALPTNFQQVLRCPDFWLFR